MDCVMHGSCYQAVTDTCGKSVGVGAWDIKTLEAKKLTNGKFES